MPGIHHLEIWVADIAATSTDWGWILPRLGFALAQEWPEGRTWSDGDTYLTLTTSPNLTADVHDRRRAGMNHVAFDGGTLDAVDALMAAAPEHGWTPLYAERYPHAGGPDHYAGWLENTAGFKVEVVADRSPEGEVTGVANAYGRRSAEYIDRFGTMAATDPRDRETVARWAARRKGPVIDAGCGPGHWTAWLAERGRTVEGIDGTVEFIDHAKEAWPGVRFRTARLDALGAQNSSLDGILAWYSLIHTVPSQMDDVLGEFACGVVQGGEVLLGLFDGDVVAPFDHKVATAYTWSLTAITDRLDASGFDVVEHHRRAEGGSRPHLDVLARRR